MRANRYKPPVGTSSPTRCASPQLPAPSSERWNYQQKNVHFTSNLFAMETAATERRGRTGREPGGTPCFWFLNLHRCAGRTPTPRTPVTDTQLSQIHRIMVVFGELPCLRSVWEWSAMPHEHEPSLSSPRLTRLTIESPTASNRQCALSSVPHFLHVPTTTDQLPPVLINIRTTCSVGQGASGLGRASTTDGSRSKRTDLNKRWLFAKKWVPACRWVGSQNVPHTATLPHARASLIKSQYS